MEATVKIFYQTAPAKRNKDNLCPVRLRVTHKGTRKYYSIAHKLTNNEWAFLSDEEIEKVMGNSPRGRYKDIFYEYKRICDEAEVTINSLSKFSFNRFDELFNGKVTKWDNAIEAILEHVNNLKEENRYSYASSFESMLRSVKEFHEGKKYKFNVRQDTISTRTEFYLSGKKLYFHDITPTWLEKFEKYLEKEGKSRSTIGIYTRNLRVIFNLVIKKHRVRAEYPFKEYQPKTSTGRKRALSALDISRISNYKTDHPQEIFYRDIFWFSFLASGMNTADIARLKYSNIEDDELVFVRQKTKGKMDGEFINVSITKDMRTIIDRHGNKYIGHDAYIFPILKPGMDEREIYSSGKQFTKMLNKYIGQIAENLKIGKITSYAARHSWATIAKNNKTPTEYIKEQLGHSNVSVTERYLKSFEKTTRKKNSQDMEDNIKSQTAGKN